MKLTRTNVFALVDEIRRQGLPLRRFEATSIPHIRRCVTLGLLEQTDERVGRGFAWRLTAKGEEVVAEWNARVTHVVVGDPRPRVVSHHFDCVVKGLTHPGPCKGGDGRDLGVAAQMTVSLLDGATVSVATFAEAAQAVCREIAAHGLGSSEWYGRGAGKIRRANGQQIAYVSYNGRVWEGVDDRLAGHIEIKVTP